ncbi:MAG: serine hydrolase [Gammaproteobacteria bacterium]
MRLRAGLIQLMICILSLAAIQAFAADPMEEKLTRWMKRNGIPGAVVEVYANGKTTSYYLGYADKKTKAPMTADTIFEIASLTKIFTTVLLADQMKAGTMRLSDPVLPYVPDIPGSANNKFSQIKLGNLATHTSGLPFNVPKSINSRKKLATYLSKWKNPTNVGASWLYSNVNMGLIGYSLEKQTQKSIYELFAEKIFRPLGMRSSAGMIPDSLMSRYAQGYTIGGGTAPRRNMTVWMNPPNSDWIFPATGALKSSGRDMAIFLRAALRLPGTPQWIADAMKVTQTTYAQTSRFQQGLAWIIHPDPIKNKTKLLTGPIKGGPYPATLYSQSPFFNGDALMEKTGASGGFRSYMAVIPNQQAGVVLLVNRYITSAELVHMGRAILLSQ